MSSERLPTTTIPERLMPPAGLYDQLCRQRRDWLVRDWQERAERVVCDLHRHALGQEVVRLLQCGSWVDLPPYAVYPLCHTEEGGDPAAVEAAHQVLDQQVLSDHQVAFRLKPQLDSSSEERADLVAARIGAVYQQSPSAQTIGQVAAQLEQAIAATTHLAVPERLLAELPPTTAVHQAITSVWGAVEVLNITDGQIWLRPPRETASLYLHSDSARHFLSSVEQAGVSLQPVVTDQLVSERDARYGSGYAWLSRRLFKQVADRCHEGLFDSDSLPQLSSTSDQAANLLIGFINQLAKRGDDRRSDIPPVTEQTSLRLGGCKDVEEYFISALELGKLTRQTINGMAFLHKTHGVPTLLNLQPVRQNGVVFPVGTVWRRPPHQEGYVPLRLTGFCMDEVEALRVLTTEFCWSDPVKISQFYAYFNSVVEQAGPAIYNGQDAMLNTD